MTTPASASTKGPCTYFLMRANNSLFQNGHVKPKKEDGKKNDDTISCAPETDSPPKMANTAVKTSMSFSVKDLQELEKRYAQLNPQEKDQWNEIEAIYATYFEEDEIPQVEFLMNLAIKDFGLDTHRNVFSVLCFLRDNIGSSLSKIHVEALYKKGLSLEERMLLRSLFPSCGLSDDDTILCLSKLIEVSVELSNEEQEKVINNLLDQLIKSLKNSLIKSVHKDDSSDAKATENRTD